MTQAERSTMSHPALAHLTLEEKSGLVSGGSFWTTRDVERAGIASATLTDGPHGVRMQTGAADHLGINDSAPATAFPTASSLGSSWDPGLLQEVGVALGEEASALGVDVLLGPGINIKRSPLCGRNFEYFSEDPLLSGALGTSWVKGVQSQGVGASVKHFAANNQETDRMRIDAVVDERTLREIYLRAFETVVTHADPATVMCSYNRLNGTYTSQHRWLLTDVLRDEWGFNGYVVSDWGAVVDPVAALHAGLDLEMPSTGDRGPVVITEAVRSGDLAEADLDLAVSRVLTVHDRLRADRSDDVAPDLATHHELARRAASAGTVLLKNDGDILPLHTAEGGRIAVLGAFADTPRYQGAGSSSINAVQIDDALSAIRDATSRDVTYAPGFRLDDDQIDPDLRDAALAIAEDASDVVIFAGLPQSAETEGLDRTTLALPAAQLDLLRAVAQVTPRVVVVLSNGGVVDLREVTAGAGAILEMWLAGEASGTAAADLLFGATEPGGRLAETIPLALADTPAHVNWPGAHGTVLYGERHYVGYRWYDTVDRDVAYPFGHGLSYTSFSWSNLVVDVPDQAVAEATVTVTLTNTGDRAGSDVVQVYVRPHGARVDRPDHELRAFRKVCLTPGESRTITIPLDARSFAYWDRSGWVVDPGQHTIEVAASSRDIRLTETITLEVPVTPEPLRADSTLREWMVHPVGGPVLAGMFESAGGAPAEFQDEQLLMMMGSMPLAGLLSISGGIDGPEAVRGLLQAVEGVS
jgi:beta-glucosidase